MAKKTVGPRRSKKCNVPDCDRTNIIGRGLCAKHYCRATKGKDGPEKDEALKYANPLKRAGKAKADPAEEVDPVADKYDGGQEPQDVLDDDDLQDDKHAYRLRESLLMLASEIGLRCTLNEASGEHTIINPANGTEMLVDASGGLHHVRRTVGARIEV